MLLSPSFTEEEKKVFLKVLSKYIPMDINLSFYQAFRDDFFLLLSVLAGRSIKFPSLNLLRNLKTNIKTYVDIENLKKDYKNDKFKDIVSLYASNSIYSEDIIIKMYKKIEKILKEIESQIPLI